VAQVILVQEEPRGPSQLVEVQVTSNGLTRVNFPDIQQLRSMVGQRIIIKGMRLITDNVLTKAPLSGNTTAPIAELKKIALTIYCQGWEKGQLIPVLTLNDVSGDGGASIPYRMFPTKFSNWENVDWSKSYLQFSNGTSSANAPYSVLFDIEYVKLDSSGAEILGAS
jgi:hypothetical protein